MNAFSFWFCLIVSFFLTACGQGAWIASLGPVAAVGGYACFWSAMLSLSSGRSRFALAFFWYSAVQAVQLSWMTSTHYMGPLFFVVYVGVLIGLGLQFGFLFSFLRPQKKLSLLQCAAFAGFWVWLEWIRIYFFTGFTWNPAGLALAGGRYSIQLASIMGIYGLSFWVIGTNLVALRAFFLRNFHAVALWVFLAIFPHGFGFFHEAWVKSQNRPIRHLSAALVETGLLVEQKWHSAQSPDAFLPPLEQWARVWKFFHRKEPLDLIVLPEGAFPYKVDAPYFSPDQLIEPWDKQFGVGSAKRDFPPLEPPYAFARQWKGELHWIATNAFLAQSLANHFFATVIVGLHAEDENGDVYNSAFSFSPQNGALQRYDKRILVPVGEYIPFRSLQWIADFFSKNFGLSSSFAFGKEGNIFSGPLLPIGVPICLEELYGGLLRDLRQKGAQLFVGLSNDVWFPSSRLAWQHFDHGRVRAVENGVFFLRSSNMGYTGAIDCFGNPFGDVLLCPKTDPGVLYISFPLFSYQTLYSLWGDGAILSLSALFGLIFSFQQIRKRKKSLEEC